MDFVEEYGMLAPKHSNIQSDIEKAIYAYDCIEPRFVYPKYKSICYEMTREGVVDTLVYVMGLMNYSEKPIVTFHTTEEDLSRTEITSSVYFDTKHAFTDNVNDLVNEILLAMSRYVQSSIQADILFADDANIISVTVSHTCPYYVSLLYVPRAVKDREVISQKQKEFDRALQEYVLKKE